MSDLLIISLLILSLISISYSGYIDETSADTTTNTITIATEVNGNNTINNTTVADIVANSSLDLKAILIPLLIAICVIGLIIVIVFCMARKKDNQKTVNTEALPVDKKVDSGSQDLKIGTDPKLSGPSDKLKTTASSKLGSAQLTPPVDQPQSSKVQKTDSDTAIGSIKSYDSSTGEIETPIAVKKKGYKLVRQIGEGAFSFVFIAINTKTGEKIACKRFDFRKKDNKAWRTKQLKTEMKVMMTLEKLHHKHIVRTYDCIKTPHSAYIFMEFAENGTISDYIQKTGKAIPEPLAKEWFAQIADAINFFHLNGIAHRDLKPENFLLTHNYKDVLVTDFGFSVIAMSDNQRLMQDTICGTGSYAAPEIFSLKPGMVYESKRVDMFALGASLFEMLNNYKLASDEAIERSFLTYFRLLESKRFPFDESLNISPKAKDCVQRLVEVKPELRITAPELLKHPWISS